MPHHDAVFLYHPRHSVRGRPGRLLGGGQDAALLLQCLCVQHTAEAYLGCAKVCGLWGVSGEAQATSEARASRRSMQDRSRLYFSRIRWLSVAYIARTRRQFARVGSCTESGRPKQASGCGTGLLSEVDCADLVTLGDIRHVEAPVKSAHPLREEWLGIARWRRGETLLAQQPPRHLHRRFLRL